MFFVVLVGFVILAYLIAIMPRMLHRADGSAFTGKYFAHRGFHNKSEAPENSMKAFKKAVERGFGIELDVQLTKDNVAVVFHDYNLNRMCGVDKNVRELTFQELQQYKLYDSGELIPKFSDALKLVGGKVPLIVELKVEWDTVLTCKIVKEILREYRGEYCIESFSPFALLWFKKNSPRTMRGQLATNFLKEKKSFSKYIYLPVQYLLFNFLTKPDFIAYDYKYKKNLSFILVTKLYGALPVGWTFASQEDIDRCKSNFKSWIFEKFKPKEEL